jgi:hypothetical protein
MAQAEHLHRVHGSTTRLSAGNGPEADEGFTEVIYCLEVHCPLIEGRAAKEVLEVLYTEVGTRLYGYVSTATNTPP